MYVFNKGLVPRKYNEPYNSIRQASKKKKKKKNKVFNRHFTKYIQMASKYMKRC